jgi:hypothetical protein
MLEKCFSASTKFMVTFSLEINYSIRNLSFKANSINEKTWKKFLFVDGVIVR